MTVVSPKKPWGKCVEGFFRFSDVGPFFRRCGGLVTTAIKPDGRKNERRGHSGVTHSAKTSSGAVPSHAHAWFRSSMYLSIGAVFPVGVVTFFVLSLLFLQPRVSPQSVYGDGMIDRRATASITVDGGWSSWSAWSTCGPNCLSHRRRTCTNPRPQNGGAYCVGKDDITDNCTGGMCRVDANTARGGTVYEPPERDEGVKKSGNPIRHETIPREGCQKLVACKSAKSGPGNRYTELTAIRLRPNSRRRVTERDAET
ncbi:unnamed protein product [Notodromas monacha]|uniref:Uncharacterized protein n=1 Tax=Notodromas monacha TaxID=399045 RepID=A0A7R9G9H2_9CRUS|nr:unnamed protein product [Notodromas monacha]CAG0913211.1 unnamed protein product [Notodromas monacha]